MRVSVTGFTAAHNQTKMSNRKKIIQIPLLLQEIIKDAGHEVGYNLPDPDVTIVHIFTLGSINSGFAAECLETIKNNPGRIILALDDWHIKHIYEGMDKVIETGKFSKTHHSVDWKGVLNNIDVLKDITSGKFKTLVPAIVTGDHSLLGVRGEFTVYDPSIYVQREITEDSDGYDLLAVHASLASDDKWLKKRSYPYLQVQSSTEDYVFDMYCKHRIVMSPPYYHNGSGWWRNRYSLANAAHAVVVDDYGSVFGSAYEIDRRKVTEKNIDELFEKQDFMYNKIIQTKEQAIESVNSLLKEFE